IVANRFLGKLSTSCPIIIASSLQKTERSPCPHPLLGRPDRGIRFPNCGPLGVKARTDWHRVVILIILARALEHLAETENGWGRLARRWINPAGKRAGH